MKKGDFVSLRMHRPLVSNAKSTETIYSGRILKYDENQECIYMMLNNTELTDLSLDAIYECEIQSENESIGCTGRIKERYCGEEGKTAQMQIATGFYKINIKYVDKQNA